MKELIPMNEHGMFADTHDVARVDSRFVADAFEKNHRDVLRGIRVLIDESSGLSADFRLRNFAQSTYHNEQGHKQPCYEMTRDGFTMLVMGFTGKKAAQFKEFYIQCFNDMEKQINALIHAREEFPRLTEQIKLLNPDAKFYAYSNECDMLNRIVIGKTAKQFRIEHGLEKGASIRPHLRNDQIAMLDFLQSVDLGLMVAEPDFQQRKRLLIQSAVMHAGKWGTKRESVAMLAKGGEQHET